MKTVTDLSFDADKLCYLLQKNPSLANGSSSDVSLAFVNEFGEDMPFRSITRALRSLKRIGIYHKQTEARFKDDNGSKV